MTIQEWFDTGCDYEAGVILYSKFSKNKVQLRLFQSRNSVLNLRKLKFELRKIQHQKPALKYKPVAREIKKNDRVKVEDSPEKRVITSKPISAYPVELHDVYKLRIQTFLKAATLKIQLNKVEEDEWETALELQSEIWELLQKNQKCWGILEHYDATGQILPTKSKRNFSNLSAQARVNERQRLYVRVSKRRRTIENMEADFSKETNEAKKGRLQKNILKKKKQLQHLQNDIDALSKLIKNE